MLKKFNACLQLTTDNKYAHVENAASYYVQREGDVLNIYFEKSNGATDWKNNFNFPAKPYRDMKNLWFCHRGFLKVWKSIEPYITEEILNPEIKFINIVGYSHGGAIAQLCYEYVKFNRPDVEVTGVGFGAPRVFWGFASEKVTNRFKGFIVVRNGEDIVTKMPPWFFGFRHVGEIMQIGQTDSHHKCGIGCAINDHRPNSYRASLTAAGYSAEEGESQ